MFNVQLLDIGIDQTAGSKQTFHWLLAKFFWICSLTDS